MASTSRPIPCVIVINTMYLRLLKRMLLEIDKRLLFKLAWNMGLKGMLSAR